MVQTQNSFEPASVTCPSLRVVRDVHELQALQATASRAPILILPPQEVSVEGGTLLDWWHSAGSPHVLDCVLTVPPPPRRPAPRCANSDGPTDGVLRLSERRRSLDGCTLSPLSNGEFSLLAFLGERPKLWFSSFQLARQVYGRTDAAGRQLVWKYASTLKKKLATSGQTLLVVSRNRGYACSARVVVVGE